MSGIHRAFSKTQPTKSDLKKNGKSRSRRQDHQETSARFQEEIGSHVTFDTPAPTFASQYKHVKHLGNGSFGGVELFVHLWTGKKRAVKIISDEKHYQTGENEAHILETLNSITPHENLIKYYEFFSESKRLYLVLEYCAGDDLKNILIQRQSKAKQSRDFLEPGLLNNLEIAVIAKQLLSVVSDCHKKNVIHCDIKAENVILKRRGSMLGLKLIDFGTSKEFATGGIKEVAAVPGTPKYNSPEIIRHGRHNEKADIWAIGVLLHILKFCHEPFTQEQLMQKEGSLRLPWDYFKSSGKDSLFDLLRGLLREDAAERVSASQGSKHGFLKLADEYFSNAEILDRLIHDYIMTQLAEKEHLLIERLESQNVDPNSASSFDALLEVIRSYVKTERLKVVIDEAELRKMVPVMSTDVSDYGGASQLSIILDNMKTSPRPILRPRTVQGAFEILTMDNEPAPTVGLMRELMKTCKLDNWDLNMELMLAREQAGFSSIAYLSNKAFKALFLQTSYEQDENQAIDL